MTTSSEPKTALRRLAEVLSSSLLISNTAWALAGYGMRLLIQAAYFILIARCLGADQYGGFVGATALIGVLSPFVGLGSGLVLIKNVARDRTLFGEYWGNGLFMTVVSGAGLFVAVALLCTTFLPIPALALVFIALSDLVFVKLVDMAAWAFQAFEILSKTAQLNVLLSLTRLIGIVVLALTVVHPTVLAWSVVYLAGSVVAGLTSIAWATLSLGEPRLALASLGGKETIEGFYFSVSLSAQTIYNDIDKTMLARLSTLEAAGIYGAAYRLIDVAFLPVTALLSAAYPGFFREGRSGIQAVAHYSRRLLKRALPYSLFASAAAFVGAPVVPWVLGHQYAEVTDALRWLALLPVLKTLHYFMADSLTGAGYQGLRTLVQVGVAVFNFLINLWIIPAFGWRGAAWSSIASDSLLALGLWSMTRYLASTGRSPQEEEIVAIGPI